MGTKRTGLSVLAAFAIVASGCGSGDDDSGASTPDEPRSADSADPADPAVPAQTADDALTTDTESAEDISDEASSAIENISEGAGTVTIALPDGRTETRDVVCSIYSDQFEVTHEYSDILDADQSVNFYYREEGTEPSDVNFTFQDPQLGGLVASNVSTASNATMSGAMLSVDLSVLIVGSADAAGNPETADISVTGTCTAS